MALASFSGRNERVEGIRYDTTKSIVTHYDTFVASRRKVSWELYPRRLDTDLKINKPNLILLTEAN